MKVRGAKAALKRVGLDAKGNRVTWNHRVVRRYRKNPKSLWKVCGKESSWLEITEVHYKNGKPDAFALDMGTPMCSREADDGFVDDAERLIKSLGWTLDRMRRALRQPILDEREDFPE